jgi:hypothetical protein
MKQRSIGFTGMRKKSPPPPPPAVPPREELPAALAGALGRIINEERVRWREDLDSKVRPLRDQMTDVEAKLTVLMALMSGTVEPSTPVSEPVPDPGNIITMPILRPKEDDDAS